MGPADSRHYLNLSFLLCFVIKKHCNGTHYYLVAAVGCRDELGEGFLLCILMRASSRYLYYNDPLRCPCDRCFGREHFVFKYRLLTMAGPLINVYFGSELRTLAGSFNIKGECGCCLSDYRIFWGFLVSYS